MKMSFFEIFNFAQKVCLSIACGYRSKNVFLQKFVEMGGDYRYAKIAWYVIKQPNIKRYLNSTGNAFDFNNDIINNGVKLFIGAVNNGVKYYVSELYKELTNKLGKEMMQKKQILECLVVTSEFAHQNKGVIYCGDIPEIYSEEKLLEEWIWLIDPESKLQKIEMIVLTKSRKLTGYCVAGINCKTGEWVRLISKNKDIHGALTDYNLEYDEYTYCEPLDVIKVTIEDKANDEYQPENYYIDEGRYLTKLDEISFEEVVYNFNVLEDVDYIYGNTKPYLEKEFSFLLDKSLILVKVTNLKITNIYKKSLKVEFKYHGNKYKQMALTDVNYDKHDVGLTMDEAYLVISTGNEWNGKFYKWVAAIYEIQS